jgi:hypothetical protein
MLHFSRNADLDMPSSNHTQQFCLPAAGALSSARWRARACLLLSFHSATKTHSKDSALAARSLVMMETFQKSGYRHCFLHGLLSQQTKRLAVWRYESFERGQPLVRLWRMPLVELVYH